MSQFKTIGSSGTATTAEIPVAPSTEEREVAEAAQRYLVGRGISKATIERYGIHTARHNVLGLTVCIPIFENGEQVKRRYRGIKEKSFSQSVGGKKTFWNVDVLKDPMVVSGARPLIITEGELDALSAIECGFVHVVSVPDGAPDPKSEMKPLDHDTDRAGKFEYMWNSREDLKKIKRFVIAADDDLPGQRLAAELVRRLSEAKCSFVEYPAGCKDLNDVLTKHGPDKVRLVIDGAKPYPVHGLYKISDYPDIVIDLFSTGWPGMDNFMQLWLGELVVISGVPMHGKSTWALNLLCHLARQHGWGSAIYTPEMPVVPYVRDILRKIISAEGDYPDVPLFPGWNADDVINNYFCFIDADPKTGRRNYDMSFDWVLDRATDAILREGVRVILIDPWNEIEHARARQETVTEYIGRSLRTLKAFAREYGVIAIVIAHPTKDIVAGGRERTPVLYDIEGSAQWMNKCDHGLIIEVKDFREGNATAIHVQKSRLQTSGSRGTAWMDYHRNTFRYTDGSAPTPEGESS
jgi:twinkle protein